MKTGAEGVNVLLGWYTKYWWSKVAGGLLDPESRIFSQKKKQKVPKTEANESK